MKRLQGDAAGTGWFARLSRQVEDRFGHWPTWRKMAVGVPIIVLLTVIFMLCLTVANDVILALLAASRH